jgi:excisionase family DNA binding protein
MSATFTLEEAARFLQLHPTTLGAKARSGEIPGAKLGKRWVFLEVDLNAKTRLTGGSKSPTVDSAYSKALGLQTGKKPGSTTTS